MFVCEFYLITSHKSCENIRVKNPCEICVCMKNSMSKSSVKNLQISYGLLAQILNPKNAQKSRIFKQFENFPSLCFLLSVCKSVRNFHVGKCKFSEKSVWIQFCSAFSLLPCEKTSFFQKREKSVKLA
jgi:hypothetical protein